MADDPIPSLIAQVDPKRLTADLFYLAKDPLPFRKVNFTLPGHTKSTLDEADDFIQARLESLGFQVEKEACPVQVFRRDQTKPLARQYSPPASEDPWYTAYNLYAKKRGVARPEEIVVVISHKDSQSWIDSPGAYDNAIGTAANLEIARLLAPVPLERSVWFVFCNEEHTPWTSVTAARRARERGDNIVAVLNLDGLAGKSDADISAGNKTSVTVYVCPEGERLAHLMAEVNETYGIGLMQSAYRAAEPNDDHGSYINEGFPAAVLNIGSYPYADPSYHSPNDVPELVDIENAAMATQASLAAIVRIAGAGSDPAQ
jgi:acetylornithine deacetylase/succinyl-diaminopimelate desuccinylase-like protein